MVKLNQIVAVVNGKKTETKKALTDLHRKTQQADLFTGLSKTYQSIEEEGEKLPDDNKAVQANVRTCLTEAASLLTDMFDAVATQDCGNLEAKADIVVEGKIIIEDVPVTYLMFLEKQLLDVEKFVEVLPVLDVTNTWTFDENQGLYVSDVAKTVRSKKVPKHKVLYEATPTHPAQIEKWTEDVAAGVWSTKKFSGAVSQVDKTATLKKIKKLQEAVKFAREEANSIEVKQQKVGDSIFTYLFL